MIENIKIIGFDADDTLWQNETIFKNAQARFYLLLKDYASKEDISAQLYKTEIANLPLYGYGVKAFTLSLLETALKISGGKLPANIVEQILLLCRQMLKEPVVMLEGVELTLKTLYKKYNLIVATKGDLLDQQRKLNKSGIHKYLHHIEIMSEKDIKGYKQLIKSLNIKPQEFLMVGNSLKSDILPVLEIGGKAIYVPFFETWQHEQTDAKPPQNGSFFEVQKITDILKIIS